MKFKVDFIKCRVPGSLTGYCDDLYELHDFLGSLIKNRDILVSVSTFID